jgi:hypothetical protein
LQSKASAQTGNMLSDLFEQSTAGKYLLRQNQHRWDFQVH